MNNHKKIWIVLSCIVLIIGAFGYGYYTTLNKAGKDKPQQKPYNKIDFKNYIPPDDGEQVNKIPVEEKVTPTTILEKKIISINTGNYIIEYNELVPESLINLTKEQIIDYFKSYGKVEFINGKITVTRELPNLPDHFVVKSENKYIIVFKTDSDGNAVRFENFEPILCKNKDTKLEKGIEVDSEDKVWKIIQDYE